MAPARIRCGNGLKEEKRSVSSGSDGIKWNFTKFLVGRQRRVVRRYAPADKPEKLAAAIEAALA